jgi:hypothetical protein
MNIITAMMMTTKATMPMSTFLFIEYPPQAHFHPGPYSDLASLWIFSILSGNLDWYCREQLLLQIVGF